MAALSLAVMPRRKGADELMADTELRKSRLKKGSSACLHYLEVFEEHSTYSSAVFLRHMVCGGEVSLYHQVHPDRQRLRVYEQAPSDGYQAYSSMKVYW